MRGVEEVSTPSQGPPAKAQAAANEGSVLFALSALKWWLPALLVAVTVVAYSPVLFNFFVGDDLVHQTWLREAVHNTELIARNFHSSWLDGTTTKFYRPLISVFMVTDYLLWQTNALGFHITNLLFHLAGSGFLFVILRGIRQDDDRLPPYQADSDPGAVGKDLVWPATAAALFALYPLHPEAVSWITGRVDAIVTAFCLGSIAFYISWRKVAADQASRKRASIHLSASLLLFVLALLSKEMAITVPAVLAVFELTRRFNIKQAALRTLPFWLVVVLYFGVRRMALGTFVGGYDDSLLFIADGKAFALNWLHALKMTFVPINASLLGAHSLATRAWQLLLAISLLGLPLSLSANRKFRAPVVFLIFWLVLCLVPVYKIFAISDTLQGSRLAYLATAPLCALLAFGLTTLGSLRIRLGAAGIALALSGFLLFNNNLAWRAAGLEANAIRAALGTIYDKVPGDPQTLLIGLPDNIKGAYVCRNALWGMLKTPLFARDISNCLMINGFDPIEPFGYLKHSLIDNKDKVRIYRWDSDARKFTALCLPEQDSQAQPLVLKTQAGEPQSTSNKRPSYLIDVSNADCFNAEFVMIKLNVVDPGQVSTGADLLFADDIDAKFELANRAHAAMSSKSGEQSLLFCLRGFSQWAFGGHSGRLKLLLPTNCTATLQAAQVLPRQILLPKIDFPGSGYMGTKGYLHLDRQSAKKSIFVDASPIPGAVATKLEIGRANQWFEDQNCIHFSKLSSMYLDGPLKGAIELRLGQFPAPGIYQARVWAIDAQGTTLAVASDHINIPVDR